MVQRSVKAGIKEFIKHEEPLVWNLILCMIIWGVILMNYQINAYYRDEYKGDIYDDDIYMTIVELGSFIFGEIIYEVLGNNKFKKIFTGCFIWSLIGSLGILINNPEEHPSVDIGF
jgi:hypothetical protein